MGESLNKVIEDARKLLVDVARRQFAAPPDMNAMATICSRASTVGKLRERVRLGVPIPPGEVPEEEHEAPKPPPAELLPYTWNEQRQMFFTLAPVGRMSSADGKVWQIHETKEGVELPVAPLKPKPPEIKNEGNTRPAGTCCKGGEKAWGKCRGCHGG